MKQHLNMTVTIPLYGASPELLRAVRAAGVNLRRITGQSVHGDTLSLFHSCALTTASRTSPEST